MTIKIIQNNRPPAVGDVDKQRCWVVLTPEGAKASLLRKLPHGVVLERCLKRLPAAHRGKPQRIDLPNRNATVLAHAAVAPGADPFKRLTAARKLVAQLAAYRPAEVALTAHGFDDEQAEAVLEPVVAALLAAAAVLPDYRADAEPHDSLKRIRILGHRFEHGFARTLAEAEGNALARYLTALPPNELTPGEYRRRAEALAKEHGWTADFLDEKALKRRHAGAFLAVCRGSPQRDAGILHLTYKPRGGSRGGHGIALVGKGICYDTGGVNVKSSKYMLGMQGDMQGSAVALGTLLALSRLGVDFQVDCWLALAMNHIGARAYIPNEVVKAADGTSIEVIHTDAEGRMVLADTLHFASRAKPAMIMDYATLTGACVYALGKAYSGVFTNRDDWHGALIETGRRSGERVWPFPQDEDYDKALSSDIADTKQCAVDGEPDHILAARFLRRFVKDGVPWVHMDLSAGECRGGLAHVPGDFTGFGIRYSCALLLDTRPQAG